MTKILVNIHQNFGPIKVCIFFDNYEPLICFGHCRFI